MLMDVLRQFKWLDIFILILLFRVCYIAAKTGFAIELFKLLGTLFAIFLSLHYFSFLSDFILKKSGLTGAPLEFVDFLAFLLLLSAGYASFMILRSFLSRLLKMEAVPALNKFGGLTLGILRGFFLVGLISFTMGISSVPYLQQSVKVSYLGKRAFSVAPQTYKWLWDSLFSKFMPDEKFNQAVTEMEENFYK